MLRGAGPNKCYSTLRTHGTHQVDTDVRAAKYIQLSPFSASLEPSFSDTRGSLNFLSVHSWIQNLPSSDKLYVCVEISVKTNGVRLNF